MKYVFIFLFLLCPFLNFGQKTDLDFLVEKIKVCYPGFKEKTKGVDFNKFVALTVAVNKADTFKAMAKIVDFFHDRHLDLFRYRDSVDIDACRRDLISVRKYLDSDRPKKRYEGYWLNNHKTRIVAIIQTDGKPLHYKAYVIENRDSSTIPPGYLYYDFEWIKDNTYFTKGTFGSNRSSMYIRSEFRNDSVMTAGPYNKWVKMKQYQVSFLSSLPKISDLTTGKWLDSVTYLLTIPASSEKNGALADSLIKANPALVTRAKTLIVDIRGNTGGTVRAYASLLPLLYTGPILTVNGETYITQDEIERNKEFISDYISKGDIDSSSLKSWQEWVKMEQDSIGKFYMGIQDTVTFDKILPHPRHVAFIMDFGCQSAGEMILLQAMQSKKVTLFGEHTMGAVDYLNFTPYNTPSGKYQLYIATSRRVIPRGGTKLDGIGIQPQVQIRDSEPDWVDFVKRYYEKR